MFSLRRRASDCWARSPLRLQKIAIVITSVRYDDDGVTDTEQTMIERCGECASVGDSSGYWLEVQYLSANAKPISVKISTEVFKNHSNNVDTDSIQ